MGLLARRLGGEPLPYITGRREFYGLSYLVGPGALIPRPETETLVEAALGAIRGHPRALGRVVVLDVGTGPGTVALAVARHAPQAAVIATDSSTEALAWADRNRERLGLRDRVALLQGDLLEPVSEPADVVLANLPYIPSGELALLPAEIREAEPALAVDGGEDGLGPIRRLVAQLPRHLAPGPCAALLEVGPGQAVFVEDLLEEALGPGLALARHRDLRGGRARRGGAAGVPPAGAPPGRLRRAGGRCGPRRPGCGAPGYGAPGYGAPGYGAPGYGAPGYGAPGYGAPEPRCAIW